MNKERNMKEIVFYYHKVKSASLLEKLKACW